MQHSDDKASAQLCLERQASVANPAQTEALKTNACCLSERCRLDMDLGSGRSTQKSDDDDMSFVSLSLPT